MRNGWLRWGVGGALLVAWYGTLVSSAPAAPKPRINRRIDMLIEPEKLGGLLEDSNLRVLDARPAGEYEAGHIPGAVWINANEWQAKSLVPSNLRDAAVWSVLLGKAGIGNSTWVVVYADDPRASARIWWLCRYAGVKDVRILDGGWKAWQAAKLLVSKDPVTVQPQGFKAQLQGDRLITIERLKEVIAKNEVQVVDARSAGEFSGAQKMAERAGRIPAARHLEWKELLTPEGKFKSTGEIVKLLAARGITRDKPAVTYCQSGGRASVNAFALELAGYPQVLNYYCSWQEWAADKEAPIESGKSSTAK